MAWFGSANTTAADPARKDKYLGPAPLAPVPLLPVDTVLAASAATGAATLAAKKQKKKAAGGGDTLLTAPAVHVQSAPLAPKALLGS